MRQSSYFATRHPELDARQSPWEVLRALSFQVNDRVVSSGWLPAYPRGLAGTVVGVHWGAPCITAAVGSPCYEIAWDGMKKTGWAVAANLEPAGAAAAYPAAPVPIPAVPSGPSWFDRRHPVVALFLALWATAIGVRAAIGGLPTGELAGNLAVGAALLVAALWLWTRPAAE